MDPFPDLMKKLQVILIQTKCEDHGVEVLAPSGGVIKLHSLGAVGSGDTVGNMVLPPGKQDSNEDL